MVFLGKNKITLENELIRIIKNLSKNFMFHSLDFGMIICKYIHAHTFKEYPTIINQVYFTKYKSNTCEATWRKMKKIILQWNI